MTPEVMKLLAIGLAMGLGMAGPAIGIGLIGFAAMQGISRNPESSGRMFTSFIVGAALAEAIGIYVFIVSLILIFVG